MEAEIITNDKLTIDELFNRSLKYRGTQAFFRFYNFIARFSHYSRFNTMLVYVQDESVTFFGGASYWLKKFNRTIKQDARPYVILKPFSPVMLVYDVLQTEGRESAKNFLERGLGVNPHEVKGTIDPQILKDALEIAKSMGITVAHRQLSFFTEGYLNTDRGVKIALKDSLNHEQKFSVFIHEIAHLFLGHTEHTELWQKQKKEKGKGKQIKLTPREIANSTKELEAETISFLICKKLGLETRAAEYLSVYISCEKDLEEFSHELVIKVADKIDEIFLKKWITHVG